MVINSGVFAGFGDYSDFTPIAIQYRLFSSTHLVSLSRDHKTVIAFHWQPALRQRPQPKPTMKLATTPQEFQSASLQLLRAFPASVLLPRPRPPR